MSLHIRDRTVEVLAFVSPERWDGLLKLYNTVVETVAKRNGERGTQLCQFLSMLIEGEATPAHYERFGRAIDSLLECRVITAVMQEPIEIPLARYEPISFSLGTRTPPRDLGIRSMLLCYLFSPLSKDALNKLLGFDAFVDEGVMPIVWPAA